MPVPSNFVSQYSLSQGRQVATRFEYADAADRNSDTRAAGPASMAAEALSSNDLGSLAKQIDDGTFHLLVDVTVPASPGWIGVINTTPDRVEVAVQKGTAGTLNKGEAVYVTGWDNIDQVTEVELAQSNAVGTMPAIGIISASATQTVSGKMLVYGELTGLDTSSFALVEQLYVSSSIAGGLQNTRPTGTNIPQIVAEVLRVNVSTGVIFVGVGNPFDAPNIAQNNLLTGNVNAIPTEIPRAGADTTAIHDNVSGEINAITVKATPVDADVLVIEDSAATFAKKKITFSSLMSGAGNLTTGFMSGLRMDFTTVATLTIQAGVARSDDDTFDIELTGAQVVNITVSGANGLDTGVEAANQWYAVWVIGDSNEVNPGKGLLVAGTAAPTLPAGYDRQRQRSWVRNQASDFFEWRADGEGRDMWIFYDEQRNAAPQRVLDGGAATTFATIECDEVIPPAARVLGLFEPHQADAFDGTRLRPAGSGDPGGEIFVHSENGMQWLVSMTSQDLQYENTGAFADSTVDCIGWRFSA